MLGIAHAISVGMSGGGGAAFNPADHGTVAWWLRGDDVTLNGADVSSWNDKSGNGRHFTQGTPSQQPLFVASAIGGQPGVQFDQASSEFLACVADLNAAGFTGLETFIVLQKNEDPPSTVTKAGLWRVGIGTQAAVPFTDGNFYDSFASSVRKNTGNPATSIASPAVYNVVSIAGEWTSFLNGTQHYTTGANTFAIQSGVSQVKLGPSAGNFLDGVVCEWLTYEGKLGAGDKTAVEAYLAARYGIVVA